MNVIWEQDGGVGRITLNRPDSLNAWTDEFGRELKQAITETTPPRTSVRAVIITGAGRGFSSGADLKAGFDPHPDDGLPDIRKELDGLYHPIIAGVRQAREAGRGRRERAGRGDRRLARVRLRPGAGRGVRLLRARLREHRPDAGRRLDAVRAGGGGQGARLPDGAARRARARRPRARVGARELRAPGRSADGRGEHARRAARRAGPPAHTPARSGRSTGCSTRTSTASSTSRPSSSTRWPAPRTSRRA